MLATAYSRLYALQRDREDFHGAEKSHTLRMKARLRRIASRNCPDHSFKCARCVKLAQEWYAGKGDPIEVITAQSINALWLEQEKQMRHERLAIEKQMIEIAKESPLAPFVERTRGFGYLGLALILAEAGDLRNYDNPAKLWKRFGLAVFDGKAQRRVTGEAAIEQGFSPKRRAVMFVIGDALVKQGAEYRQVYLDRKAYEVERNPEIKPIAAHRRAQRFMEKRLLRELWKEAR